MARLVGIDMKCKCIEINKLEGNEAIQYARNHLRKVKVDGEKWEIEYICPESGIRWIEDFPYGESHGGGPSRLRKIQ